MWSSRLIFFVVLIGCALADCDNDINVEGVSSSFGNEIVNGNYIKIKEKGCDSRDVFNHTHNDIYLYHIEDGIPGYWIFRDQFDCGNGNIDDGYVRTKDAEFNPGFIISGWEEKVTDGHWERDNDIDVDCYELPSCRYRINGATNTSLNAYYDLYQNGNYECQFRDVHKHETMEAYLYFVWSDTQKEYFWVVNREPCVDAVYRGAYLQNDDFSIAPEFIFRDWEELRSDGAYAKNPAIDVDCFDNGLSPGATAGIVIGCLAAIGIGGVIIWWCCLRD